MSICLRGVQISYVGKPSNVSKRINQIACLLNCSKETGPLISVGVLWAQKVLCSELIFRY